MPADETPDQALPSTIAEPQEDEGVEGHRYLANQDLEQANGPLSASDSSDEPREDDDVEGHNYSLAQDPDFDSRALSAHDENAPAKSDFRS